MDNNTNPTKMIDNPDYYDHIDGIMEAWNYTRNQDLEQAVRDYVTHGDLTMEDMTGILVAAITSIAAIQG